MRIFTLAALATLCACAFAQIAPTPHFDLADVHLSARQQSNSQMRGGYLLGDRYELRSATMLAIISRAYGVDGNKILGGPGWIESTRYDIIAKARPGTSREDLQVMVQSLLAERFGLAIRRETKDLPAYALVVGKRRPPVKPAATPDAPAGCEIKRDPPEPTPGALVYQMVACRNMSMAKFADGMQYYGRNYVDRPVLDKTSLDGAWDFDFKYSEKGQFLVAAGPDGITFQDALEKQMNLRLEPDKMPTPVLVVERANEKPTPNGPDISEKLPPVHPEFEVASLKTSAPGVAQRGSILAGGRVELFGVTLKSLISFAYDDDEQHFSGEPKWFETDRFDLVAKAATGAPGGPPIEFETTQLMLRTLLADRFKLAFHYEDQPATVYALVAPKGAAKLKKAVDDSNRSGCKYSTAVSVLSKLYTCLNTNMDQFAARVRSMGPSYVDHPVINATGIEGSYDFLLSFTPNNAVTFSDREGGSAPTGAMTIFEALDHQLGMKLELQKHPLPTMVIDHVEKPAQN
jgi:uncharacterized protein (TIGR03435 family)